MLQVEIKIKKKKLYSKIKNEPSQLEESISQSKRKPLIKLKNIFSAKLIFSIILLIIFLVFILWLKNFSQLTNTSLREDQFVQIFKKTFEEIGDTLQEFKQKVSPTYSQPQLNETSDTESSQSLNQEQIKLLKNKVLEEMD